MTIPPKVEVEIRQAKRGGYWTCKAVGKDFDVAGFDGADALDQFKWKFWARFGEHEIVVVHQDKARRGVAADR